MEGASRLKDMIDDLPISQMSGNVDGNLEFRRTIPCHRRLFVE